MFTNIRYSIKFVQINKAVCAITLFAFIINTLCADLALASVETRLPAVASSPSAVNPDTFLLEIPSYLGYIKDSYRNNPGKHMVIHIQDAHCNYAAQNSIYELIDYLNRSYGAKVINLEGGEGQYDLSQFNVISDPLLREKTADYFLREGIIGGPEFYAVKNPGTVKLVGVEDTALYRENLDVYRRSLAHKPEVDESFNVFSYNLALIKSKAYSKPLIEFDMKANSFKDHKIDLKEYSAYIAKCALDNGIDLSGMVNLAILARTLSLEGGIDFKKSTIERDELIGKLAKYMPKAKVEELGAKTVEFKAGRLTPSEFYAYIFDKAKSADIDLSSYQNLASYYVYIAAYDRIKKEELFKELSVLEMSVKEKLFSSRIQRDLDRITQDLAMLKGMLNITITPDEFSAYKARKVDFDIKKTEAFIRDTALEYSVPIRAMQGVAKINSRLREMVRFYELSYKRDEAFIRNIKNQGPGADDLDSGITILITGGFHGNNLARLLKANRINYVSVMPNFQLDDTPCPYFKRLAGDEPAIFKKMSAGRSAIAIYTYFCEKAKEIYGDDVDTMMNALIRVTSELLSDKREAVAGAGLRFKVSSVPPEINQNERIEEVPGSDIDGKKIYAVWDEGSEIFQKDSLGISTGDASALLSGEDQRSLTTEMSYSMVAVLFNTETGQRFMVNIEPEGDSALELSTRAYGKPGIEMWYSYLGGFFSDKVSGRGSDWHVLISKGPIDDREIPSDEKIGLDQLRAYIIDELGIPASNIASDDTTPPADVIFKHIMLKHDGLAVVNYSTHSSLLHGKDFNLSGGSRRTASWIGSKVLRGLVLVMIFASAMISAVINIRPVYAAADSISTTLENMSTTGKLYEVVDVMWGDSEISGILSQYKATDQPHKVQAMADLAVNYFDKIPYDLVEEYKGYAKMAGLSENAWVIFAALELTETSGAQVVDPGNADKLVNQQDGGMGPLQVMKAQCTATNGYMDSIQAAIDAGTMKSAVDRRKMAILGKFGFTSAVHIDIERLNPYSINYDRKYACLVGAAIMALNNQAFSERYFVFDKDAAKYEFKRLEEGPADGGYDKLLAAIAAYNLGFDDIRDLLVGIGPWHGVSHITWYKSFLAGLETKITQSHNVRFRTFVTMILYMFPDNADLRSALQSLGYDVDFVIMEPPASAPELQVPVTGQANTGSQQAALPTEATPQVFSTSIFKSWPFWGGISFIMLMGVTLPIFLLKLMCFTRKVDEELEDNAEPKFVNGSIYNRKFIAKERRDRRFTVVFDMDRTLVWDDPLSGTFYLRPFTRTLLELLKLNNNVKVVLWTSAPRKRVERVFQEFPELIEFFDRVITRENYAFPTTWEHIKRIIYLRHHNASTFKDLSMFGYKVLVDDAPNIENSARSLGFTGMRVDPFDFDTMIKKGGMSQDEKEELMDAISQDTEMMSSVWRRLAGMVPSDTIARIGKRAAVVAIKGKKARVRDSNGKIRNLKLNKSNLDLSSVMLDIKEMSGVEDAHKGIALFVLKLFDNLPVNLKPDFFTFDTLIDDLFGFASPHFNCVSLYDMFSDDPVAVFHEIAEYLVKSGQLHIKFEAGKIMIRSGKDKFVITPSEQSSALASRYPRNAHYLLRALQADIFKRYDMHLSSMIESEQKKPGSPRISVWQLFLTKTHYLGSKTPMPGRDPEIPAFMEGRIYDLSNIAHEKADERFTAVFDLDDVLIQNTFDGRGYTIHIRPDACETLEALRQRGIKLVLWTSEDREWVKMTFAQHPDLKHYFERIITSENYLNPTWAEFISRLRHFKAFGDSIKNISLLGYDVIVDDDLGKRYYSADRGFNRVLICLGKSDAEHESIPMLINDKLRFRALIVKPFGVAAEGIEMAQVRDVIFSLLPPPTHMRPASGYTPGLRTSLGHMLFGAPDRDPGYYMAYLRAGLETPSALTSDVDLPTNLHRAEPAEGYDGGSEAGSISGSNLIMPDHIKTVSKDIASALSDSYIMTKPCTIGMVVKSDPGQDVDRILAERFAGAMESIGQRIAQAIQIDRGVIQYDAGAVKYIAYVDDGTDSSDNIRRIRSFRDGMESSGNPRERRFAWVLSSDVQAKARLEAINKLSQAANLVGLSGEYLPVSWQMLAGPLFANLIDSKNRKPEEISQERIDAIVDAIIGSICLMTRTGISEWNTLRQELRTLSKDDLAQKFNGTFFIKLPPMMPVSDAIEQNRKADLEVQTAL